MSRTGAGLARQARLLQFASPCLFGGRSFTLSEMANLRRIAIGFALIRTRPWSGGRRELQLPGNRWPDLSRNRDAAHVRRYG
jgi:hypothetical protein